MKLFLFVNAALVIFFASAMIIESVSNPSMDTVTHRIQKLLMGVLLCWIVASVIAVYHA